MLAIRKVGRGKGRQFASSDLYYYFYLLLFFIFIIYIYRLLTNFFSFLFFSFSSRQIPKDLPPISFGLFVEKRIVITKHLRDLVDTKSPVHPFRNPITSNTRPRDTRLSTAYRGILKSPWEKAEKTEFQPRK